MSKSTIAATEGASTAILAFLARKEEGLRAELAKIQQVRAILGDKGDNPNLLETVPVGWQRRGRPKKAKG